MKQLRIVDRTKLRPIRPHEDTIRPSDLETITIFFENTLPQINLGWVHDRIDEYQYKYGEKPKEILVGLEIFTNIINDIDRVSMGKANLLSDYVIIADVTVRLIGTFKPRQFEITHKDPSLTYLEAVGRLK